VSGSGLSAHDRLRVLDTNIINCADSIHSFTVSALSSLSSVSATVFPVTPRSTQGTNLFACYGFSGETWSSAKTFLLQSRDIMSVSSSKLAVGISKEITISTSGSVSTSGGTQSMSVASYIPISNVNMNSVECNPLLTNATVSSNINLLTQVYNFLFPALGMTVWYSFRNL
jgi:hypothetical protein